MHGKGASDAAIERSPKFRELVRRKRNFILASTIFFLVFYFLLPILTSYSDALNHPAIGPISWAWIFAFAQFIMTWAMCILYSRRAAKFDETIAEIKREVGR